MTTNAQLLAFCLLLSLLSRAEAECRFDAERSELWCDLSDLCGKKDLAKWFDKTKIIQINPGKRNCTSLPDQNIFASFRKLYTFYFNAWLPQINFTFSSAASKESFMFANSASRKYLPKLNGDIFKFKNIYFKNDPFKFYQLSDFKVSFKNKFNFDRSPKMKKTFQRCMDYSMQQNQARFHLNCSRASFYLLFDFLFVIDPLRPLKVKISQNGCLVASYGGSHSQPLCFPDLQPVQDRITAGNLMTEVEHCEVRNDIGKLQVRCQTDTVCIGKIWLDMILPSG